MQLKVNWKETGADIETLKNVISDLDEHTHVKRVHALDFDLLSFKEITKDGYVRCFKLDEVNIREFEDGKLSVHISLRSSVEAAKEALIERVGALVHLAGGTYTLSGSYPGWQYRADSPLREKMIRIYKNMYGTEPKVEAIHAGLECGILADKIPDLDCVSIGPDMKDIHTTKEKLSIPSTSRVWDFVLKMLEEKEQ